MQEGIVTVIESRFHEMLMLHKRHTLSFWKRRKYMLVCLLTRSEQRYDASAISLHWNDLGFRLHQVTADAIGDERP